MTRQSPARTWWRQYHRAQRVARREAAKATLDLILFGTGVVIVPNDGSDPRHVPLPEVFLTERGEPLVAPTETCVVAHLRGHS